jgi:GNAT superfamily N-acetyltransferase
VNQNSCAGWRLASETDDLRIVSMSAALNREDPGPNLVPKAHVIRTLRTLRSEPWRGRAVVIDAATAPLGDVPELVGYAFLIAFWSNELGGEVCTVDELYVVPAARGGGLGGSLFDQLLHGELWVPKPVALELETTPDNARARRLYERNGFVGKNLKMRRLASLDAVRH